MTVDPLALRRTMRRWASGVTIVSSSGNGRYHGMTVSSFTSVSLDPPLILVSLENKARTHEIVSHSNVFAVSILAEDQREISDVFAGRVADDDDRFQDIDFKLSTNGCPIPNGSLAYLDCRVQSEIRGGTHTVFMGEVIETVILREAKPLVYFDQDYRLLDMQPPLP